jgi:opacity protein-like surface antigen
MLVTALSITSWGQGGGVWNFTWDIGFPVSSTNDFISQTSFRGFAIEGRGYVSDRFLVGGRAAWNTFYEDNGFITEPILENATIYGYNRRYLNAIPLMVTAHYEFGRGMVLPYAGIGLGTYYIETRDYLGIYYVREKAWHFGVYPEVGIVIPFGSSNSGVNINAKYNYAAKTSDTPEQSWISLGVGISYIF